MSTVYASGDRTVRVIFDTPQPPQHRSSTAFLDALNPRSWSAQIMQDAEILEQLTTLSVAMGETEYIYDILFLEPFPAANAAKELHFSGVVIAEDISDTYIFDEIISGCIATTQTSLNAQSTALGLTVRDIANTAVTAPGTLIGGDYSEFVGGILPINSAGDYVGQSGEALIRKLILRRLISKPGDFFHLPKYGAGLGVKETFSTANLRQLATSIELQVLQEPEIEKARANLSYQASSSALLIQVQARMRSTGQQIGLSMNLPLNNSVKF